jgi:creatinine deaminase
MSIETHCRISLYPKYRRQWNGNANRSMGYIRGSRLGIVTHSCQQNPHRLGACIDDRIVAGDHNQRVQKGSSVLHAEMDCLENAGRLTAADYRKAVLYSTLSPCDMCSGAILLYGFPKVVVGENLTFQGPESYLQDRGVKVEMMNSDECKRLMDEFIAANPALWNEDIGVTNG